MYDSSVSDLANGSRASGWRLPGISPLFWIAILIGPTSYLYSSGDLVAAIVWGSITLVGWIGSTVGLLRPVSWMVSGGLASAAAHAFSSDLEPKVQEFTGMDPKWTPLIALVILFLASLLVLHLFVWRPLQQFISSRPTLSKINALGGFTLAVGKYSILLVLVLSGAIYLDDHPSRLARFQSNSVSESIDLPGMVRKTADATRASRVGSVIDGIVDWDQLAASIDVEEIRRRAASGEGPLAKFSGGGAIPGLSGLPAMNDISGFSTIGNSSPRAASPNYRVTPTSGNANQLRTLETQVQSIQQLNF